MFEYVIDEKDIEIDGGDNICIPFSSSTSWHLPSVTEDRHVWAPYHNRRDVLWITRELIILSHVSVSAKDIGHAYTVQL